MIFAVAQVMPPLLPRDSGGSTTFVNAAIKYVTDSCTGKKCVLVGHSLGMLRGRRRAPRRGACVMCHVSVRAGGGMAQLVGTATGIRAMSFSGPGVQYSRCASCFVVVAVVVGVVVGKSCV
jgi:hypothetical protein